MPASCDAGTARSQASGLFENSIAQYAKPPLTHGTSFCVFCPFVHGRTVLTPEIHHALDAFFFGDIPVDQRDSCVLPPHLPRVRAEQALCRVADSSGAISARNKCMDRFLSADRSPIRAFRCSERVLRADSRDSPAILTNSSQTVRP